MTDLSTERILGIAHVQNIQNIQNKKLDVLYQEACQWSTIWEVADNKSVLLNIMPLRSTTCETQYMLSKISIMHNIKGFSDKN